MTRVSTYLRITLGFGKAGVARLRPKAGDRVAKGLILLGVPALVAAFLTPRVEAQTSRLPRTAAGKPNLNGIWQAMNTANWDLQPHSPAPGRVVTLGAEDAEPPGIGVVEGGTIPYLPAALAKRQENFSKRVTADPELKCYLPGVPRATYMPFPFQIFQTNRDILITYQFAGATRTINMGKPTEAPTDYWMGWSTGHWEGDTLVECSKCKSVLAWRLKSKTLGQIEHSANSRFGRGRRKPCCKSAASGTVCTPAGS